LSYPADRQTDRQTDTNKGNYMSAWCR